MGFPCYAHAMLMHMHMVSTPRNSLPSALVMEELAHHIAEGSPGPRARERELGGVEDVVSVLERHVGCRGPRRARLESVVLVLDLEVLRLGRERRLNTPSLLELLLERHLVHVDVAIRIVDGGESPH